MKTGLPTGLQGLLAKLGIGLGKTGEAGVSEKALAGEPKEGKDAKGVEKGEALGDGTLLAGLGFSPEDRRAAMKNVAEQSNIDRFLQDPSAEVKEMQNALRQMKDAEGQTLGERPEVREAFTQEPREKEAAARELREDVRREEKVEDLRSQAQETKEQQRERETNEAKEREREQEQEQEDEGHGQGWVQEELEEREEKKRRGGLREDDTLGEHARCRGEMDDGTRCLRKPVSGTPYCRAHFVPVTPIE